MKKIKILLMLLVVATSTQAQNIFSKNSTLQIKDMTFECKKNTNENVSIRNKNAPKSPPGKLGNPSQQNNSDKIRKESQDKIFNIFRSVFSIERAKTLVEDTKLKTDTPPISWIRIFCTIDGNGDVNNVVLYVNENLMLSKEELYKLYTQLMQTKILHVDDYTGTISMMKVMTLRLNTLYK